MPEPKIDPEVKNLFYQLKEKFGSHKKVAEALELDYRTYAYWRLRGFSRASKIKHVKSLLRKTLQA